MKFKKDKNGLEYTNASGAADYLNMPRTTFLYFYNPAATLVNFASPLIKLSTLVKL